MTNIEKALEFVSALGRYISTSELYHQRQWIAEFARDAFNLTPNETARIRRHLITISRWDVK